VDRLRRQLEIAVVWVTILVVFGLWMLIPGGSTRHQNVRHPAPCCSGRDPNSGPFDACPEPSRHRDEHDNNDDDDVWGSVGGRLARPHLVRRAHLAGAGPDQTDTGIPIDLQSKRPMERDAPPLAVSSDGSERDVLGFEKGRPLGEALIVVEVEIEQPEPRGSDRDDEHRVVDPEPLDVLPRDGG
jgi:hypothetical protein